VDFGGSPGATLEDRVVDSWVAQDSPRHRVVVGESGRLRTPEPPSRSDAIRKVVPVETSLQPHFAVLHVYQHQQRLVEEDVLGLRQPCFSFLWALPSSQSKPVIR
jgi:hypothetical protein